MYCAYLNILPLQTVNGEPLWLIALKASFGNFQPLYVVQILSRSAGKAAPGK